MIDLVFHGRRPSEISERVFTHAIFLACHEARRRPSGGVSIRFVSRTEMARLNRRWRGKSGPTDVLSFTPAQKFPSVISSPEWGDLILCPAYIRNEAKRRHISFLEETLRVTIHGMLHLFGYDHVTLREERRMFGLQEKALAHVLAKL